MKSEERYIVNDNIIMNYGNMLLDCSRKVLKNVVMQFKYETENYSNILFGQWHGLHYLTLTIIFHMYWIGKKLCILFSEIAFCANFDYHFASSIQIVGAHVKNHLYFLNRGSNIFGT